MIVDWAPWNHTAGGNHNFGLVLLQRRHALHRRRQAAARRDRGDRAQPARDRADLVFHRAARATRRCCRICAPTRRCAATSSAGCKVLWYRGRRHCAARVRRDQASSRCRPAASASCSSPASARPRPRPSRWRRIVGRARSAQHRPAGAGLELKLVPRSTASWRRACKGPNVTPGYWRQPELTAKAFDEEGFYKLGDALRFDDPDRPATGPAVRRPHRRGLQARDRHLGQRRPAARRASSRTSRRYVRDVVIAGADRDDIARADLSRSRRLPRAAPRSAADGAADDGASSIAPASGRIPRRCWRSFAAGRPARRTASCARCCSPSRPRSTPAR